MIDAQRIKTMTERLGDAVKLIDNKQFLPMYRNRQIHYPELFEFSKQLALKKKNPSRYFSTLWSNKNLKKTLEWLQKLVNLAKSKAMEMVRNAKRWAEDKRAKRETEQPMNRSARRRYEQMLRSGNIGKLYRTK